ncbi:MAG: FAD-binding oxidoreductase [Candidatus Acidiferrales bacterium]
MSTASKTLATRLPDIVGAAHAIGDPAQLGFYEIDGVMPGAAVRPGSREEIVEVVKFAAAENLAVIASGARTKLGIGMTPRRYDIALDMTRMDRLIAYDPADLTLAVEAGHSLRKLLGILGDHRQFLPLLVPYFNRTTIGGTIASGVDSPLRHFYGTARDYVLGMEYVTGEGVLAKTGGRVVKNVSGYDLHKLMIGALGTLGAIVSVNFKTFPSAIATRGFVATFEGLERAIEMRERVAKSALTPLTMEILSPRVTELFASEVAARIGSGAMPANVISAKHWTFSSGYGGNEKVLGRYESEYRRMAGDLGAAQMTVLDEKTRPPAFSRKREFVPIALASSPATTIMKLSVQPARMKEALAETGRAAEGNSLPWAAMARGVGVIYIALLPGDRSEESRGRVVKATEQIIAAGAKLEANATIPWAPSEWKSALKIWGLERADFAQMQKVKKVFDPNGILSPGRFVGGL